MYVGRTLSLIASLALFTFLSNGRMLNICFNSRRFVVFFRLAVHANRARETHNKRSFADLIFFSSVSLESDF